jgi:hypothetical protein
MGPSPCGCVRMVAELLLGHQTPCMLPRSISGVLGDSSGLCGPPWVKKMGPWRRLDIRTLYAPYAGGSLSGGGPLRVIESFFPCDLLCCTIHNGSASDHGPLKTTCHRG